MTQVKKTIVCLALASLSAVSVAQDGNSSSYSAETYGEASGDTPLRGLGLVLELVDGESSDPKLRLFGGPAGQAAAIVLSTEAARSEGPRGSTLLVEDQGMTIKGTFDSRGYFEVPVTGQAASIGNFHAQGTHVGIFDLAGDGHPLKQYSNGLRVFPTAEADLLRDAVQDSIDARRAWELGDGGRLVDEDLHVLMPERQKPLGANATLAERLQRYLNSAGDSTKIKLHVEASAKLGGEVEVEFLIERTAADLYEVKVSADAAATAGFELAEGFGLGLKAGVGAQFVYRFYSAEGAARGLMGMVLGRRGSKLIHGSSASGGDLDLDAQQKVQALELSVQLAQENQHEAEAMLWEVLDVAADEARSSRNQARTRLKKAESKLKSAPPKDRPYWALQVSVRGGILATAEAHYQACKVARKQGEEAVEIARVAIEQYREELRSVLAAAARLHRIGSAVAQLSLYMADHFAGVRVRAKGSLGGQLGIPFPVKVAFWGLGVEGELELEASALFEDFRKSDGAPRRITVTGQREFKTTLVATGAGPAAQVGGGGEYQHKRTATVVESFELEPGVGYRSNGIQISFARDIQMRAWAGAGSTGGAIIGGGFGRKRTVALGNAIDIHEGLDLEMFTGRDALDLLGDTEVGVALQHRRVTTVEHDFILGIFNVGGGWKLDIEWADQGRQFSRSNTIRAAVENVLHRADQILP